MKKLVFTLSLILAIAFAGNSQVFYKVSGNGLAEPSYLFGTHHLAPLSIYNEMESAKAAFEQAKQVVGEIDMTGDQMEMAMKMQPFMMAPTDSTLTKVIPADKFAEADEQFKKLLPMPGISLAQFDPLKPMVATQQVSMVMIMQNMQGYNPNEQLDSYFQVQGVKAGKKIVPLETVEQQAELLFCYISIADQADALLKLLAEPEDVVEEAKKLNEAYFKQDLVALYELTKEEDEHPEFFEKLLNDRNADWMTKLPAIMEAGSSFIAVGCLHLAGEHGLVEQLRKLGYEVEAVK